MRRIRFKSLIRLIWRGIVFTYREIFSGFLLAMAALFILIKISGNNEINAGLLAGLGIAAGFAKGLAKFIILELFNKIPSEEISENYPKYKMLFVGIIFFAVGAFLNYGFNIVKWISSMALLLSKNYYLSEIPLSVINIGVLLMFITGIISYIFEPRD